MARNLENSTSENFNIQEMRPRRSTEAKCDNKWSGTTTTRLNHGNHRGGHNGIHPRRGPWHQTYGPSHAHFKPKENQPMPAQIQRKPNALTSRAQAKPKPHTHVCHMSSSLFPPNSPLPWPNLLSAEQPTHVAQACLCGLSSSPSWPKTISTIWT